MNLTRLNELADCYNKELDQQRENLTQEIREEARRILNQFDIQKISMQTGTGVEEVKGMKNVLEFAVGEEFTVKELSKLGKKYRRIDPIAIMEFAHFNHLMEQIIVVSDLLEKIVIY